MNCIRWFIIFCIFVFEKTHLGIRIDANTVFTFLFFLWMPLKNNVRWWKNSKNLGFHVFYQFSVTKNRLLEISSTELNHDLQHHSVHIKNTKNQKYTKNNFFNLRRTSVSKTFFLKFFFFHVFSNFNVDRVFNFSILVWWPLLISFHMLIFCTVNSTASRSRCCYPASHAGSMARSRTVFCVDLDTSYLYKKHI